MSPRPFLSSIEEALLTSQLTEDRFDCVHRYPENTNDHIAIRIVEGAIHESVDVCVLVPGNVPIEERTLLADHEAVGIEGEIGINLARDQAGNGPNMIGGTFSTCVRVQEAPLPH